MTSFAAITVVVVLTMSVKYTNQDRLLSTMLSKAASNKLNYNELQQQQQQQHTTRRGYVMALKYSGQQGAGIQALISLQCWATSFHLPVAILEPIMPETVFISIPPQHNSFIRFSDLFDIEHFNRHSQSLGFVPIGTREDFITNAPTEVIYFRIQNLQDNVKKPLEPTKIVDYELDGTKHCYEEPKGILKIDRLGKANFCITRMVEAEH